MMGLNKLGTTITALIAVMIAALAVEIIYVLWRRRQRYHPRVRIEPQEPSLPSSLSSSPGAREHELELELEQHVMKFQRLCGPSRFLFTIMEDEEREGLDSENGSSTEFGGAVVVKKVVAAAVDEVAVKVEELLNNEATTPFSTPCASPPYYTPYSSPCREAYKDNNNG